MLAISVFEALRDAVGALKPASERVMMVAPGTAEHVLQAVGFR